VSGSSDGGLDASTGGSSGASGAGGSAGAGGSIAGDYLNCGTCAANQFKSKKNVCTDATLENNCGKSSLAGYHAVVACSNAAPTISACHSGWASCDGSQANGCETSLVTNTNCGACGVGCGSTEVCTPSGCAATCDPPNTPCAQGACTNLATSIHNCGNCGTVCNPAHPGATPKCVNGTCDFDCGVGYTKCGNSCVLGSSCSAPMCEAPINGGATWTPAGCKSHCPRFTALCPGPSPSDPLECVSLSSDANHCGACGAQCSGVCVAGSCEGPGASTVATLTSPPEPHTLRQDATHLYWISGDAVLRVSKQGGTVETIASGQFKPYRVVVAGGNAYWSNNLGAAVVRAPVTGGAAQVFAAANLPTHIASEGSYIYWVDEGTLGIRRAPVGGGPSVQITALAEPASNMLVDSSYVYWTDTWGIGTATDYLHHVPNTGGTSLGGSLIRDANLAQNTTHVFSSFRNLTFDFQLFAAQKPGMSGGLGGGIDSGEYPAWSGGSPDELGADDESLYMDGYRIDLCGWLPHPYAVGGSSFVVDQDFVYSAQPTAIVRTSK
jgi:hypothetical protein